MGRKTNMVKYIHVGVCLNLEYPKIPMPTRCRWTRRRWRFALPPPVSWGRTAGCWGAQGDFSGLARWTQEAKGVPEGIWIGSMENYRGNWSYYTIFLEDEPRFTSDFGVHQAFDIFDPYPDDIYWMRYNEKPDLNEGRLAESHQDGWKWQGQTW